MTYWAVYKGDDIITHGNLQEVADRLEIELDYAKWLITPSVRKRMSKSTNRMIFIPVSDVEKE